MMSVSEFSLHQTRFGTMNLKYLKTVVKTVLLKNRLWIESNLVEYLI